MIISYDKMNQLRHVRFLKNKGGRTFLMAKHRRRLVPLLLTPSRPLFATELTPAATLPTGPTPRAVTSSACTLCRAVPSALPSCAKTAASR